MKWVDNILVATDGTLFTVLPSGTLEIRGEGWGRRRKHTGEDRVRVCRLGDEDLARSIAEEVASLVCGVVRR